MSSDDFTINYGLRDPVKGRRELQAQAERDAEHCRREVDQ